jgi:ABC-type lipoprotein release transport system permease subunit
VVTSVFARPLAQVGLGVAVGGVLAGLLLLSVDSSRVTPAGVARLAAYAVLMLGVCLLACIVPTRRALRIPPTQALRADG